MPTGAPGLTTDERQRLKDLERENRELKPRPGGGGGWPGEVRR